MSLSRAILELGIAVTLLPLRVSQRGISTAQYLLGRYAKEFGRSLSDSEYANHRLAHPVARVLRESSTEIVIETLDGMKERWVKPNWRLEELV